MDAQVQIMQVAVGTTRTGKTYYDIACSDGVKRRCWDAALAQQINAYTNTGQAVTIRFEVTQNGQYTNYNVKAFAPPGAQLPPDGNMQAAPMGQPQQQFVPQPQGAPIMGAPPVGPPMPQAQPNGGGGRGQYPPEVTTRITKLAAYEYAAIVVGGLFASTGPEAEAEAIAMLDRIAKHVYQQARSHESAAPAQVIQQPAEVAQFVNEQQSGPVAGGVQVGAPVGVAAAQDAAAEAPDVIQWD